MQLEERAGEVGQAFGEALLVEVDFLTRVGRYGLSHGDGLQQAQGGDGQGAGGKLAKVRCVKVGDRQGGQFGRDDSRQPARPGLPGPAGR